MRCTSPRTVGFLSDGKTLCWSQKHYSKEFATFQLPCSKCLSCRLEYGRQWAIRCVHEAQMHPENCFITLTYDEKHLTSDKLIYTDFQTFVKNLRSQIFQETLDSVFPNLAQKKQRQLWRTLSKERQNEIYDPKKISIFVTGEYGDQKKRPHWHALIFNWRPTDCVYKYSNERGDKSYSSDSLSRLWPHGIAELGAITFESAGYCARYAAKKLTHGHDGTHDYNPISKKSARNAIGKKFIEEHWQSVFAIGKIILPNGKSCSIPRYYEKWLKDNQPEAYNRYVTQLKNERMQIAIQKEEEQRSQEMIENLKRSNEMGLDFVPQITKSKARAMILERLFEGLQKHLKL
nr:MAG: replication initiator protein [Microvirus sp.]